MARATATVLSVHRWFPPDLAIRASRSPLSGENRPGVPSQPRLPCDNQRSKNGVPPPPPWGRLKHSVCLPMASPSRCPEATDESICDVTGLEDFGGEPCAPARLRRPAAPHHLATLPLRVPYRSLVFGPLPSAALNTTPRSGGQSACSLARQLASPLARPTDRAPAAEPRQGVQQTYSKPVYEGKDVGDQVRMFAFEIRRQSGSLVPGPCNNRALLNSSSQTWSDAGPGSIDHDCDIPSGNPFAAAISRNVPSAMHGARSTPCVTQAWSRHRAPTATRVLLRGDCARRASATTPGPTNP